MLELPHTSSPIMPVLVPVVRLIAEQTAELAMQIICKLGGSSEGLEFIDYMAIGARARIGSLEAMRFFDYVPLERGHSLAAERFALEAHDPTEAAAALKAGLIYDAFLIDLHHFTPFPAMLLQAITTGDEDIPLAPVTALAPCSKGAIQWYRELGSPLHYHASAPSLPSKELKPLITKVSLEAIKEKELITEREMALLLSIPAKTLGNRRRATEVNRSVYTQKKPNASAWYQTTKALTALQSGTFFVTPKPVRKK